MFTFPPMSYASSWWWMAPLSRPFAGGRGDSESRALPGVSTRLYRSIYHAWNNIKYDVRGGDGWCVIVRSVARVESAERFTCLHSSLNWHSLFLSIILVFSLCQFSFCLIVGIHFLYFHFRFILSFYEQKSFQYFIRSICDRDFQWITLFCASSILGLFLLYPLQFVRTISISKILMWTQFVQLFQASIL